MNMIDGELLPCDNIGQGMPFFCTRPENQSKQGRVPPYVKKGTQRGQVGNVRQAFGAYDDQALKSTQ